MRSRSTTCCSRRRCRATRWKARGRRAASCRSSIPVDGSDLLFELLSTVDAATPREGTGIVSVLRNVTDLRRATEEIEENYRRLRIAEAEVRAERDRLDLDHRLGRRSHHRDRSRRQHRA